MADRCAKLSRKTKETDISVGLNIDGTGKSNIDTGIGFFNHMLEGFSKHGFFDLDMTCDGDLNVDCHASISHFSPFAVSSSKRLFARTLELAVKNILTLASGSTTVPISLPSITTFSLAASCL